MKTKIFKSYQEMLELPSYEDRLEYLMIFGHPGEDTFGSARWVNQEFYHSSSWQKVRNQVIIRDLGCDLAISDREIKKHLMVHHINPIDEDDILFDRSCVLDLNNLVCVSKLTHNIIHYGYESNDPFGFVERKPNDTCLWK